MAKRYHVLTGIIGQAKRLTDTLANDQQAERTGESWRRHLSAKYPSLVFEVVVLPCNADHSRSRGPYRMSECLDDDET